MRTMRKATEVRRSVVVRLAGDAGDSMYQAGILLGHTVALAGCEFVAQEEPPAEIRTTSGSLAGVASFQVHFGSGPVHGSGDRLDALVAMNPAALHSHCQDLAEGGVLILNRDQFTVAELNKAGYQRDPIEDGSLKQYRVLAVPITTLNRGAVGGPVSPREADRGRNIFALGLILWLFEQPLDPATRWIERKLDQNPQARAAWIRSLRAGYHFGETTELLSVHYTIPTSPQLSGRYRKISGIEGLGLGLVTAAKKAGLPMLFAGYPSTPAGDLQAYLTGLRVPGLQVLQMEDQAAGIGAALGASFGGGLGVSACSSPGLDLSTEGLGLAVMSELPLVLVVLMRAGPSTGLPSKSEQVDLLAALFGRHGECPLPVLAAGSPADCFATTYEAVRLAIQGMTPVIVLADGYLAQGIEPWCIPGYADLPPIQVHRPTPAPADASRFAPFQRNRNQVRSWPIPGTPGFEHRLGGLEQDESGTVSFDPINHERMVQARSDRIAGLVQEIPELQVEGSLESEILVVSWGSTRGVIASAVEQLREKSVEVAWVHLRHLNPLPANLGEILKRHRKILIPELNRGHLRILLRATYLVDAVGLNKIQGRPLQVGEVEAAILALLNQKRESHG